MFCQNCGAPIDGGVRFCPACGKAVPGAAQAMPAQSPAEKLRYHLQIMGVLWIVYGCFRIVGGISLLAISHFVAPLIAEAMNQAGAPPAAAAMPNFIEGIFMIAFCYSLVIAMVAIIAGWALLRRKSWGRVLGIVIAVLSVLAIPVGTALGIYTMVILFASGAEQTYRRIAAPA